MTTQTSLTDLTTGDTGTELQTNNETQSGEDTVDSISGLKETLKDIGVNKTARSNLTEEFESVDDLTRSSDIEIKSIDNVGQSTIETIRQELDDNVGDDYRITDSGEGYCESEWTEKADEDEDILTGEILMRDFVTDEFGHQSTFLKNLTNWVSAHDGDDKHVSQDLVTAAYNITPEEAHMSTLFDEDKDFESEEAKEEAKQEAVLKARAVMAFADMYGHRDMYLAAAREAREQIEAEAEAKRKQKQKEKKAERFLKFPDDEIGGWQRIKYGLNDIPSVITAYRGTHHNSPSVVALYDTGEFIKVKGFRHMDWVEADQDPVEAQPAFSTAKTPETEVEGAIDLQEWLESHPSGELIKPSRITFENWYLTKFCEGEKIVYEEPEQNARIIADGCEVTLKANGEQQTVEEPSHQRAKRALHNYIYCHPAVEDGGIEIEVPCPDGSISSTDTIPLEDHPEVADIDIKGMETETNAEGWNTFPHPQDIQSHVEEDLSTDQVLPQEVKETIDELKEEPHVGDFLVFDAQDAYEYLEKLQKNSDLHLENFHRSQLLIDQMAQNANLSTYDKEFICEWETRRRLAEREFDSWGQAHTDQLSKENSGLPNKEPKTDE